MVVRVRPLLGKEERKYNREIVEAYNERFVVLRDPKDYQKEPTKSQSPVARKEQIGNKKANYARGRQHERIDVYTSPIRANEKSVSPPRNRDKIFAFDHSFGKDSTQEDLFKKTTESLCPTLLDGFNSTVFAYGSTGAGKTFTMIGS